MEIGIIDFQGLWEGWEKQLHRFSQGFHGPAFPRLLRSGPVSYTHLDVYKRQDEGDAVVRKVDTEGTITTFAGNGSNGPSGDGGPASQAAIGGPRGITIYNDALYISNDGGGGRIRYVDLLTNIIQTYVGSTPGYDGDGHLLTNSQLDRPSMVIFNAAGNICLLYTSRCV